MKQKSLVVEIVTYRLAPGVTLEQFTPGLAILERVARESFQGFRSRVVYHDAASGEWCEILHWDSIEDAKRAEQQAAAHEECLAVFGMIDPATIQMRHMRAIPVPAPAINA